MCRSRRTTVRSRTTEGCGMLILSLLTRASTCFAFLSAGVRLNSATIRPFHDDCRDQHQLWRSSCSSSSFTQGLESLDSTSLSYGEARRVRRQRTGGGGGARAISMYVWQPIRYAVVFTGGIAFSTWVNGRVNRRNERIRRQQGGSGPGKGGAPSPEMFIRRIRAIHESAAVNSAVELKVFTKLGALCRRNAADGEKSGSERASEGVTAAQMAQACGCAERGMRILLDALSGKFITKRPPTQEGEATYELTPSSAMYLDEDSDACIAHLSDWYFSEYHLDPLMKYLTESVRRGGSALPRELSVSPDDPRWLGLAETFGPVEGPTAAAVAKIALEGCEGEEHMSVLDVAVGHGMYGIQCARQHPGLSVTALGSLPLLQKVAVRNAKEAGVLPSGATAPQITLEQSDLSKAKTTYTAQRHAEEVKRRRYRLMDGNAMMMDSWGEGLYDMVILPHFLHVFDEAGMRAVLRKAKKALKPDGRCAIVDVVPDANRMNQSTDFSLIMLANTPHGDAYTFSELRRACLDSGFVAARSVQLPRPKRGQPSGDWKSTLVMAYPQEPKDAMIRAADMDEEPSVPAGDAAGQGSSKGVGKADEDAESDHEAWAYPMSLGDFFSIFEGIIKSYIPGGGGSEL